MQEEVIDASHIIEFNSLEKNSVFAWVQIEIYFCEEWRDV